MPWTRLDPEATADALRVGDMLVDGDAEAAAEALAHLRHALLTGIYIAVQDHEGHTFIGTPAEVVARMMA